MPKHISVKNQNWTIIFGDLFCFSLSSVQPKKIDSPDSLPPSYRRLLSGNYITGRRGVICDLDCSLYPCTAHRLCFYTVESSKPSIDRLINLLKYYAMLRKTAEGNNYGRITTRLTYYKVSFSSRHLVPRSESLSEFDVVVRVTFVPTEHWIKFYQVRNTIA